MRMTRLFGKTLRQDPSEAETASHRLMLRAGLLYQVASGVYAYPPLAHRSLRKIEEIIRQEMDTAGAQELKMPTLQPLELWQQTERDAAFGQSLFHLEDRRERLLVLAPTHEEVITQMVRSNVSSYRDLPLVLYQIQTKFRDEPRPRAGLLRVREFDMKDAYSFDADEEGLALSYQRMVQAYRNIFRRCGLPAIAVEADSGAIGGKESQEFVLPTDAGEDTILHCRECDYAANAERAVGVWPALTPEAELPLEEVDTPGVKTIDELAGFLGIPRGKTLKAVFYAADGRVVLATLRGDLEVNEVKLKNVLHAHDLRLATEEEVAQAGLVAGSASPIGLRDIPTIGDESVRSNASFVVGANKPGHHLRNANYPRDFSLELVADIALAEEGHGCPRCGHRLEAIRGIEVGHVFKLGTFFSERLGALYLDSQGQQRPIIMGCYGIGVGRLLGAAVEQNHDERGIIFPAPIAPYQIHLVSLNPEDPQVRQAAEEVYARLQREGMEVLFDDREESAGVKFNDADLLGLPVRLVVSPRTLRQSAVEVKGRPESDGRMVSMEAATEAARETLGK